MIYTWSYVFADLGRQERRSAIGCVYLDVFTSSSKSERQRGMTGSYGSCGRETGYPKNCP